MRRRQFIEAAVGLHRLNRRVGDKDVNRRNVSEKDSAQ